jgi:ATP-dependent exoDNAse (exonuclease V) alpha subunit
MPILERNQPNSDLYRLNLSELTNDDTLARDEIIVLTTAQLERLKTILEGLTL